MNSNDFWNRGIPGTSGANPENEANLPVDSEDMLIVVPVTDEPVEVDDTPVWCMIYDHLCYEHEAHIFAEQQKHHRAVAPYDTFNAHLESCSEKHMLIRDLVYSYNLELGSKQKRHGTICAIAALENIFDKYGYHVLDKALRILVSTWEGEMYSLSGNTLNAVARLIAAFGDALNEETFKERLGLIPMKTIIRTARERRPGSLGYAEAMLVFYNKKCKYRLSMKKLYGLNSDEDDLEDDDDSFGYQPLLR